MPYSRGGPTTRERKANRQVRPTSTPSTTSVNATLGGKGVRQTTRQVQSSSPLRRKARKLRRVYREEHGTAAAPLTIETAIRQRRKLAREEEDEGSLAGRLVEHGVLGEIAGDDAAAKGRELFWGDENPGLKELGITAAEGLALGAAGKAIGIGGKAVLASKAGSKAKDVAEGVKVAKKVVSTKRAVKTAAVVGKVSRKAKGVAAKTPKPVKTAAATAKRVTRSTPVKVAGKSVKVATAPVRAPLRYGAKHPFQGAAAVVGGPGVAKYTKTGDEKDLTAAFEAYAEADPKKVALTTLRAAPSLLAAPLGIAANVGLSGKRAAQTAIPGGDSFSGGEILEPTKKSGEEVFKFGKEMAETFGSGDKERIKKAVEEEYGLTPAIMVGIPGAKTLQRAGAGRAVGRGIRKVPGARKVPEALDRSRKRKDEAKDAARTNREGSAHALGRTARTKKGKKLKEVPGLLSIQRRLQKSKVKTDRGGEALKTLAEEGPTTPAHVARLQKKYPDRPEGINPEKRSTAEVARDIDEKMLADRGMNQAREQYARFQKEGGGERSEIATNVPQATTWDVPLPWERTLTNTAGREISYFKNPANAKQKGTNAQLEAEFLNDMKRLRAGKLPGRKEAKGLAEPTWTHDADIRPSAPQDLPGSVRGYEGRTSYRMDHQNLGKLQKAGLADPTWEGLVSGSIVKPSMMRAQNAATRRFAEREFEPFFIQRNGKDVRVDTRDKFNRGVADGLIDLKQHGFMDAQEFKAAVLDAVKPDDATPGWEKSPEAEMFVQSVENATKEIYGRKKGGDPSAKGKIGGVVDLTRLQEFKGQRQMQNVPKWLTKAQRGASRALLGYSPSWLAAQPIAESAQGLAAVGVTNQLRGMYEYRKMDARTKAEFDANLDVPGMGEMRARGQSSTSTGDAPPWKALDFMRKTAPGRVVYGIGSGRYARAADRAKALAIRRSVAAGGLIREYDRMRLGMAGIMRHEAKVKGMSKQELFQHYSKDAKGRKELGGYVDDVMGNWDALTVKERSFGPVIIFYPFVRMSLKWVTHTFPNRHPIKASIHHFLAQQNAAKMEEVYEGKPPFFAQYANAPIYGGPDGEPTGILPLSRVAPGSNAVIEALGDGSGSRIHGAIRSLNPGIGALAAASSGQMPETGRGPNANPFEETSEGQRIGLFFRALVKLPTPIRAIDTATGERWSDKMIGREMSKTRQLFRKLGESESTRIIRSSIFPFLPQNAAQQRVMADVGRLLELKFEGTDDQKREATDLLDNIYKRFGLDN